MKKILLLIIPFIFLLSSCAKSPTKEMKLPIDIQQNLQGITFEENIPISIAFWNIQDMVQNTKSDAILNHIEELFNITIEPVSMNWTDYKERYKIQYATNTLPDVFANLSIPSSDKGIRSLPDDLSNFPYVDSLLGKIDYIKYSFGKNYFIPRLSFEDSIHSSSDSAMIVRRDWIKKLGLSQPHSLSEFINLVSAFANDDPDGNGKDDTIGYNVNNLDALGKWLMLGISPDCNVYSWVETENGYIPSYLTNDFKKVVLAYRTLYERGGLDPNFYLKKSSDATYDFAQGKLGALEYKSSPAAIMELQELWELYNDQPFEECVDVLHIFPTEDGNYYSNSSKIFWSETYFSSNVDDEKMERILYLIDYLLSPEGSKLMNYGIEGVDYVEVNGEYECLLDLDTTGLTKALQNKYPSLLLFGNLAIWGGTYEDFQINKMNQLQYGEYAIELSRKELQWNMDNTIQISRPYDFMLMPKEDSDSFNKQTVKNDFIRVIIGTDDPIKTWDSYIDKYYAEGIGDYIERQNQLYDEYLHIKE